MSQGILGVVASIATISMLMLTVWDMGVFASPLWETDIEGDIDGLWEQEIIIEYVDGSTDSLKILKDSMILSATYKSRPISAITYRLSLKVAYDGEIDNSNYKCIISTNSWNTTKTYSDLITVNANEWVTVATTVINNFDEIPTGSYIVMFYNSGFVKIRDYDAWTEINPPETCKGVKIVVSDTEVLLN